MKKLIKLFSILFIFLTLVSCHNPFSNVSVVNFAPANLEFDKKTYFYGEVGVGSAALTKFTLHNTSQMEAFGCENLVLSDNINFSVQSTTCDKDKMKMNDSCEVNVLSQPQSLGVKTLTLSRKCENTKVTTTENQITAVAITPSLVWSPLTNDFNSVYVGSSSAAQTFTLTNNGVGSATGCSAPMLTDSTNFEITTDSCGSSNLPSMGNCQVTARARPQSVGLKQTHIYRTCAVGGTVSTTAHQIRVEGTLTNLSWSPDQNDFGTISVGSNSAAEVFELVNTGTAAATSCGLVSISNATDFTITNDTCGLNNLASGGGSCSVEVQGHPQSAGLKQATLSRTCFVGGTVTTLQDQITVTGASPNLYWSMNALSIGNINVGANSSYWSFFLQNNGSASATGCSNPVLSNNTDFSLQLNSCGSSTLNVGDSCHVSVRANPQSTGLKTTTLSRSCTYGGVTSTTTDQITVNGTLIADWQQEVNSYYTSFSNLGIIRSGGGSSAPFKYYFRNPNLVGLTGCTLPAVSNTNDFSIVSENCGTGAMDAASLCEVVVKVNPLMVGAVSGSLNRTCNETGLTSFSLNASGVANTTLTYLAASGGGPCMLLADGTVKCISGSYSGVQGNGNSGRDILPVFVSGVSNAIYLDMGSNHGCAVLNDNSIKCWGQNSNGVLGDGTTTNRLTPIVVTGVSTALQVSAGDSTTCSVLSDSTLRCWGSYPGNGSSSSLTAVAVSGISNAVSVSAGYIKSCAVLSDATLKCWGEKTGDGTWSTRNSPVVVTGITNANQVSAGGLEHSCVSLTDGTVKCWGYNSKGQLGDGTTSLRSSPVLVTGISNATKVKVGNEHSCALLNDGTVKCWGDNQYGQLGNQSMIGATSPVTVVGISNAVDLDIAPRGLFSCATLSDGSSKCWGYNSDGRLGNGSTSGWLTANTLTRASISSPSYVGSGYYHICALISDGTVKCWGKNSDGQLGDGTIIDRISPVSVSGLTNVTQLAINSYHGCARISDGTIKCWGKNSNGQLGDGTAVQRNTPVSVLGISNAIKVSTGYSGSCAILSDQTVKCWGVAVGDGTSTQQNSPVVVAGLSNVVDISVNGLSCAVISDGTIKCWGYNFYGGIGDGTTTNRFSPTIVSGISNAVKVGVGGSHVCAVLSDGTAKCWGYNGSGQLGDNTMTNRFTPITSLGIQNAIDVTAAGNHTCVMLSGNKAKCMGMSQLVGSGQTGWSINTPAYRMLYQGESILSLGQANASQCVITVSGKIQCTGNNENAQIDESVLLPQVVGGF